MQVHSSTQAGGDKVHDLWVTGLLFSVPHSFKSVQGRDCKLFWQTLQLPQDQLSWQTGGVQAIWVIGLPLSVPQLFKSTHSLVVTLFRQTDHSVQDQEGAQT